MNLLKIMTIFIFGSIIGSFLNVCITRIPKEESIVFPPSHCMSCGYNLNILDLIPIFSWIFLNGRCRCCGEKVSKQYPIIEVVTGLLFIFLYFKYGFTVKLLKYIIFTSVLIVIGIIDFKTQYVYDCTIIVLGASGIIFTYIEYCFNKEINFINILFGVIIPVFIISIFALFGVMGWGDVEIIGCVGLFLGIKLNILNLFVSIIMAGITAILLIVFKIKGKNETMAFGQFISISSYIMLLFGNELLEWYINFMV